MPNVTETDFPVREIHFCPYQTGPRTSVSWSGLLFRVCFEDGKIGYADYTPLETYGDAPLTEALVVEPHVFSRTLAWARVDADARSQGRSLWETPAQRELPAQENHFLVRDFENLDSEMMEDIVRQGFSTVKIKLRDPGSEIARQLHEIFSSLTPNLKIRLDLNSSSSSEKFRSFVHALPQVTRARIEFVEDPFPFSGELWSQANAEIPLAIDHEWAHWDPRLPAPFCAIVIKPARQNPWDMAKVAARLKIPFVVTSSLDHWLGVVTSAWVSSRLREEYPDLSCAGGCLTFPGAGARIWENFLHRDGNRLRRVRGTGFGFDEALAQVEWRIWPIQKSASSRTQAKPSRLLMNPRAPATERAELESLAALFQRHDGVWIASSGSSQTATDSAKLVHLPMEALECTAMAMNRYLHCEPQDLWLQALPDFHVGGFAVGLRARLAGFRVLPALEGWNAESFWQVCDREGVTLTSLVPTQVYDLIQLARRSPSRLRAILVGGASLPIDLYRKAWELGYRLYPSYGMTETGSAVAAVPFRETPVTEAEFAYRHLDHMQVDIDGEGALRMRGPGLAEGFAQKRSGQSLWQVLRDEWGFYTTTDVARWCGEGSFVVLGRQQDYVKVLGEGVHLSKIQSLLDIWMPGSCAIYAEGDERKGHRIGLAVLETVTEPQLRALEERLRKELFPYERPQKIRRVREIPRSPLGKILREKL